MVLFLQDRQFTFDFTSKYIPYKRKQEIRRKIVGNGGTISYLLTVKVVLSNPNTVQYYNLTVQN